MQNRQDSQCSSVCVPVDATALRVKASAPAHCCAAGTRRCPSCSFLALTGRVKAKLILTSSFSHDGSGQLRAVRVLAVDPTPRSQNHNNILSELEGHKCQLTIGTVAKLVVKW